VPAAALQVAPVGRGGEPAVDHPDHPVQVPFPQVVLDRAQQQLLAGVPGEAPHAHRDALAGDRQPDHHLRQVLAVVLAAPVAAGRAFFRGRSLAVAVAVAVAVAGFGVVE
jgi:hypothetical protein